MKFENFHVTEEVCDMVPGQAQHWEMAYFCVFAEMRSFT